MDLSPYLEFAAETAYLAGRLTLGYFQAGVRPDFKADDTPVTRADREAEQMIRRRIEARVGERRFRIRDVVENVGHTRVSHMLLYHCNAGFPVVDEGAELLVPSRATTTSYGVPIEGYRTMSGPIPKASVPPILKIDIEKPN